MANANNRFQFVHAETGQEFYQYKLENKLTYWVDGELRYDRQVAARSVLLMILTDGAIGFLSRGEKGNFSDKVSLLDAAEWRVVFPRVASIPLTEKMEAEMDRDAWLAKHQGLWGDDSIGDNANFNERKQ